MMANSYLTEEGAGLSCHSRVSVTLLGYLR